MGLGTECIEQNTQQEDAHVRKDNLGSMKDDTNIGGLTLTRPKVRGGQPLSQSPPPGVTNTEQGATQQPETPQGKVQDENHVTLRPG